MPRRCFTTWASMPIAPTRWRPIRHGRSARLNSLKGLEQLRFMENSHKVLCVEVEAKDRQFWELNNPEDVPKIEAMMAEMGLA